MASLDRLNDIVGEYEPKKEQQTERRPFKDITPPKLMQNAHFFQDDDDVNISGQKKKANYKNNVTQLGSRRAERDNAEKTNVKSDDDRAGDAIDGQTQILKTQAMATQKQSGILSQHTGLMQEQIRATAEVSDVVQRLTEYLKREASKPVPKVQQTGGNTYEGEFKRVPDKNGFGSSGGGFLDEINEWRQRRNEKKNGRRGGRRGRRGARGGRGRWKLPSLGTASKLLKVGGVLGGGLMAYDGLSDIAKNEGKGLTEGGLGSRGAGYAQAIGGGAMTGAAVGSLVPIIGTAVGAVVGGAIGGLAALLTDNQKAISRGLNTVMGRPQSSPGTYGGQSAAVSADIGDAAMTKGLGAVSASFESGGKGVGTISSGKGDRGGQSYGKHQLSSKTGSMTAFLRSDQGKKYYNQFRGMEAGSEEFNKKYAQIAKDDGEAFGAAQQDYIGASHYDPVSKWFQSEYKMDLQQHSRALKEALYSVSVQYGPSGAKKLVKEAYDGIDVAKTDDSLLIEKLQTYRADTANQKFASSSNAVQNSVRDRAGQENIALQKMLKNERNGDANGGSGIGSQYSKQMIGIYSGKGSGNTGSGSAPIGILPMGAGGGSNPAAGGDEAGGGTAAAMLSPADGAMYAVGMKATVPNNNTVNMSGLNPKFKQAWFTMVGDWVTNAGGKQVNVASAFRTRMEQEQLWVKYGRNTKRVAKPGTSRHESGFAIDIDRTSAQSLETTGMFKKYGFHRPLSNEPWHIELIGAGGAAKGGAPAISSAAQSPQLMQQAAVKEMDKAAEGTIVKAEENTKSSMTGDGVGIAKAEAEVKANPSVNAGAAKAEAGLDPTAKPGTASTPTDTGGAKTVEMKKEAVPPTVNAMSDQTTIRNTEQQALYEQYLKAANGDPRLIPPAVADPSKSTDWGKRADIYRSGGAGGNPSYGSRATPVDPTTKLITGEITRVGSMLGVGSFGSMFPGANDALRGVDSQISKVTGTPLGRELQRIPGMPSIPRLASGLPSFGGIVNGIANVGTDLFNGGKGPSLSGVNTPGITRPTNVMGAPASMPPMRTPTMGGYVNSTADLFKAPSESPASTAYYKNDTPIQTRASAQPAMAMSAVTSTPVAAPAERNSFDGVQKVAMVNSGDTAPADSGGGSRGGSPDGGSSTAGKNDMPQLEDVPAMIDDLGLIFINSGYV